MIFISYSRKNEELVLPVAKLLRVSGQKIFLDVLDLEYGGDWKAQLTEAIGKSSRFLLFWSKSSKDSPVVRQEWNLAVARPECSIVPILLDGTPLPPELEKFHGTSDLAPLFHSLTRKTRTRQLLWISWLIFAGFLATVLPIGYRGPIYDIDCVLRNVVPWLMILFLPVFFIHHLSRYRSEMLLSDLATKLAD